ncbi:hypothetical protein EKK58_05475 [Candidatus Dependentiae bacterium]|nr:MAG: hypothetical protein EKK58_05475 [Candidatus Dependentiae bacterium]
MQTKHADHQISIIINDKPVQIDIVEVLIARNWGVEEWGVGVGRNGKLLDYFEYARQGETITAINQRIPATAPNYKPMPTTVQNAVVAHLRSVAAERHLQETKISA